MGRVLEVLEVVNTRVRGRDIPGPGSCTRESVFTKRAGSQGIERRPAGQANHEPAQTGSCPCRHCEHGYLLRTENRQLSIQALPVQENQAQCRELGLCTFCVITAGACF